MNSEHRNWSRWTAIAALAVSAALLLGPLTDRPAQAASTPMAAAMVAAGTPGITMAAAADDAALARCMRGRLSELGDVPRGWTHKLLQLELGPDRNSAAWQSFMGQVAGLLCGAPGVQAQLESELATRPSLWATVALMVAGQRDVADLVAVIPDSAVAPADWVTALQLLIDLQGPYDERLSLERMEPALAWASASGDRALEETVMAMRSVLGDPQAQLDRGQRLLACIAAGGEPCLRNGESHSASVATLAQLWEQADVEQQVSLLHWMERSDETADFLIGRFLELPEPVQRRLLDGEVSVWDYPHAVTAARKLLDHLLAVPQTRPPAVALPLDRGPADIWADLERYPSTLYPVMPRLAFDILHSNDDPQVLAMYREFDALDHPWLTTLAGRNRLGHEPDADPFHLLRHAIESDGLPLLEVLRGASIRPATLWRMEALMVVLARQGRPHKWAFLSQVTEYASELGPSPPLAEAIGARLADLPARMDRILPDAFLPADWQQRIEAHDESRWEFDASGSLVQWLHRAGHEPLLSGVAEAWLADPRPLAQYLAMVLLVTLDDARALPLIGQFESHPEPSIREVAEAARRDLLATEGE